MKQWLNTPVTYGCMIRILLVCIFICLLLVSDIDIAFNIGGSHWTAISAIILTSVGIIIGLGQWLIPFPLDPPEHLESMKASTLVPVTTHKMTLEEAFEFLQKEEENYLKTNSHQETGTLIISTNKENRGVTVYLLSRGEFHRCKSSRERDNNSQKKTGTITCVRVGPHLLFVARFRDLKAGRYNIWRSWGKDDPKSVIVQVDKGSVSELELDWRD